MSKKRALGKGMDALFGNEIGMPDAKDQEIEGIQLLPLDHIKPNTNQPRRMFDTESLKELAESIRQQGVVQPILAEKLNEAEYYIIAGERRWRAAKLAGLNKIPVMIREFNEEQKLEITLVENIQREDLTPIEEATAYSRLMETLGLSQQKVAEKVGKNRSTVANSLRLLRLSQPIKDALDEGKISAGHARALLSIEDESKRETLFTRVLEESLSVRETENATALTYDKEEITPQNNTQPAQIMTKDPELVYIEEKIIEKLGTKVILKGSMSRGKIEISWYNPEDLDRIYEILLGNR